VAIRLPGAAKSKGYGEADALELADGVAHGRAVEAVKILCAEFAVGRYAPQDVRCWKGGRWERYLT